MLKTREIIITGIFVTIIIIGSFIKIPVYPVPVVLTFMVVNLISLISPGKISFYSVLIYILMGLCGLPVFSQGGGIGYVTNVTFGYILGFLLVTLITPWLNQKAFLENRKFLKNIVIGFINILVVYITGLAYGYFIISFYLGKTVELGNFILFYALIFIPGDTLAVLIGSYLCEKLKRTVKF